MSNCNCNDNETDITGVDLAFRDRVTRVRLWNGKIKNITTQKKPADINFKMTLDTEASKKFFHDFSEVLKELSEYVPPVLQDEYTEAVKKVLSEFVLKQQLFSISH